MRKEQNDLHVSLLDQEARSSEKEGGDLNTLKPSLLVILPSCILTAFLLVGLVPLLPELQLQWFKSYRDAQYYSGILTSVQAFLTFFTAPQAGAFSDYYGRKPLMLLTSIFSVLPILGLYLTNAESYMLFYTVNIIGGIFGIGKMSAFAFIGSYVADCSAPEHRTRNLGYVGATTGVVMALTPLLNKINQILETEDFLLFLVLLGILNALYIAFVVPESKSFDNVPTESTNLFKIVNPMKPLKILHTNKILKVLSLVIVFGTLPESGVAQIALLYLNEVYGLSQEESQSFDSIVFGAMGISMVLSLSLVVQFMLKLKLKFSTMIFISQIANSVHMIVYGSLSILPQWVFFLNCIPIGLCFITDAATKSFVSFNIDKKDYGLAFGTIGSIKGLCGIMGPLLFSEIYAATGNGSPFFLGSFLAFLGVLVTWFRLRKLELQQDEDIL